MKRIFVGLAVVLALALNCAAQERSCQRITESAGGFSMCVPDGWTAESRENEKYKMIFGPRGGTFTPNINFKNEAKSSPLADYVTANVKNILENTEKLGATSIRLVDRSDFVTDSKLAGVRASFSVLYKGIVIRTIQYYFNGKEGQKLAITATSLEINRETLDPVFDRAMRTFRLEQ
jgi:hypothetical protein